MNGSTDAIIPNISGSRIDNIMTELTQSYSTPESNVSRTSPMNSRGSPVSPSVSSCVVLDKLETLKLSILERSDRTVFSVVTFPTLTVIKSISGETSDGSTPDIEQSVASPYGMTTGQTFDETIKFLPGDYCLGVVFRTKEDADRVISIKISVMTEQISNLMLFQVLFGLYRSLGFEPSHVLKYPVKSHNPGIPFYRKTRSEIREIVDKLKEIQDQRNKEISTLERICQLLENQKSTPVSDLEKVFQEKATYFQKLKEAEDYIDYLNDSS